MFALVTEHGGKVTRVKYVHDVHGAESLLVDLPILPKIRKPIVEDFREFIRTCGQRKVRFQHMFHFLRLRLLFSNAVLCECRPKPLFMLQTSALLPHPVNYFTFSSTPCRAAFIQKMNSFINASVYVNQNAFSISAVRTESVSAQHAISANYTELASINAS